MVKSVGDAGIQLADFPVDSYRHPTLQSSQVFLRGL